MANVLGALFQDIADAIKRKTGSSDTMKPMEFPSAIDRIEVGSGGSGGSGGNESGTKEPIIFSTADYRISATTNSSATARASVSIRIPSGSHIHAMVGGKATKSTSSVAVPGGFTMYNWINSSSVTVSSSGDGSETYYNVTAEQSSGSQYRVAHAVLCVTYSHDSICSIRNEDGTYTLKADSGLLALPYTSSAGEVVSYDDPGFTIIDLEESQVTFTGIMFQGKTKVHTVKLPATLTTIAPYAFKGCSSLKSINLENVQLVHYYAFQSCTKLESVKFRDVTELKESPFAYCSALKLVDMSECTSIPTLGYNVFGGLPDDAQIKVPAALYDEWITTGNWANYVSKIVPV